MLNCKDATQLTSRRFDEKLPLGKRIALRLHLMMCIHCARYARQLRNLRYFVSQYPKCTEAAQNDETPTLPAETQQRLDNALTKHLKS